MIVDLNFLILTLVFAFGLTSLITSMFEIVRTGFILTLHVGLQMLAFLASLVTLLLMFLDPNLALFADFILYSSVATAFLAIFALLVWLKNMFTGLMLFRCMQGASFHTQVLSHQVIFVILSLVAILALFP